MAETLQDRLAFALDPLSRTLRDQRIQLSGNEFRAIKFTAEEMENDIDEEEFFFDDHIVEAPNFTTREISVILSSLEEIPLSRLRRDLGTVQTINKQALYLYDVLPMEIHRTRRNI